MPESDPYLRPAFSWRNRAARLLWQIVYAVLFRPSPRVLHEWRAWLLKMFGAKIARGVHIYPSARIWAPWNLICEEVSSIGPEAIVYNPLPLRIGTHAVVSQYAYLCGATHDYEDPDFPLIAHQILIGPYAWICARATVQPGVKVGEGAVLALGSVATKDLAPWTVYGGVPARRIKAREVRGSKHRSSQTELGVSR